VALLETSHYVKLLIETRYSLIKYDQIATSVVLRRLISCLL